MKKKIIIGVSVLFLIIILITIGALKSKSAGAFSSGKAISIKSTQAKIQEIKATVPVSGNIEEIGKSDVYIDTSLRVNKVYVEKNDVVKTGQKLVDFDLSDLYSQLNETRINLNIQNINYNKIKDSFKTQNTQQLQSSFGQAELALNNAKQNYERVKKLYNSGVSSLIELENSKSQFDSAQTQYTIAQNNYNDLNKNNEDLANNNNKDIQSQFEQVKLIQLRVQDLERKINRILEQSKSPIDGIITEKNVEHGNIISPAQKIFSIMDTNKLQIKLEVKEVDILKIKEGQEVEVTGDAFPGKTIIGSVKSIGATAIKKMGGSNSDDAVVEVLVSVDNSDNILKPGLSVNAKIITQVKQNAVVISFDSFQEDKDGNKWVFVIENNIAKQKSITVGISSDMNIEVLSGLDGTEKLVQDPPSRLKDGMKVTIQK